MFYHHVARRGRAPQVAWVQVALPSSDKWFWCHFHFKSYFHFSSFWIHSSHPDSDFPKFWKCQKDIQTPYCHTYFMEASPNWSRSDKLIIDNDFEDDIKISSKRASVNPLAGFLKPLSPASATATASASSTNSSSSAQAEFSGGSRTQKWIPDRALPKCPRTQKLFPRPPHELKSKNKLIFWKCGRSDRSDREPTVITLNDYLTLNHP